MGQEHKGSTASEEYFRGIVNQAGVWSVIRGFRDGHVFTAPVASFSANALGIYDLGGNVWEWCEDKDPGVSSFRILHGGSWSHEDILSLESWYRAGREPNHRNHIQGFRCVLVR